MKSVESAKMECNRIRNREDFKTKVVDELEKLTPFPLERARDKCDMCMINSSGVKTHDECPAEICVCTVCEKTSYLNPITCGRCAMQLEPTIGGKQWAAILVAGTDKQNKHMEETFKEDINKVKSVIMSRAPVIFGIRSTNIETVDPEKIKDSQCKMSEQILRKINTFNTKEINTLFVYFSCHGGCDQEEEGGSSNESVSNRKQLDAKCSFFFDFGSDDRLTIDEFSSALGGLINIKNFIIFLDCCYPQKIQIPRSPEVNIVQINVGTSDKEHYTPESGSRFTSYLVQGLKGGSEGNCGEMQLKSCKVCTNYLNERTHKKFVTPGSLYEYVKEHMSGNKQVPHQNVQGDMVTIAYFSHSQELIDFTTDTNDSITLEMACLESWDKLNAHLLLRKFGNDPERDNYEPKICTKDFSQDSDSEECTTVEKVREVWEVRKPLFVEFKARK